MDHVTHSGLTFAKPSLKVERRKDGTVVMRSEIELGLYPNAIGQHLVDWTAKTPDQIFLAQRNAEDQWEKFSYSDVLKIVRSVGQYLLNNGFDAETPVMILSDNSLEHAFLSLGAMYVGVPVVPVSQAYSLMSTDHGKLKYIHDLTKPRLIYAADGAVFEKAIAALDKGDARLVTKTNQDALNHAISIDEIIATDANGAVDDAFAKVTPDTIAKILFTSGSTGIPKGVLNTQRMLTASQQALAQVWPFLEESPPVIVDWLPWNHTFGGNHNFNLVLRNGGTFYIDAGKPAPGLIEKSAANLRDVPSTIYFNVPRGFDMIIPHLEADETLREAFFRDLKMVFYAAAALPQNLWERLEAVAKKAGRDDIFMTSSWGSTETSPLVTSVYYPIEKAGVIGLPVPGTQVKLAPEGDKMELRVKGPNVTPGYFGKPDLMKDAFDEDGFYRMGDAGKFEDPDAPERGLVFDGRTAENFKLSTGVWVHVGALRLAIVGALNPLAQDVVISGHDRDELGLLVFLNPVACATIADAGPDTPLSDLAANENIRSEIKTRLAAYNENNAASSTRIARAVLLPSPPGIDANEITDKGYINQRAVLERRAETVEKFYSGSNQNIEIV